MRPKIEELGSSPEPSDFLTVCLSLQGGSSALQGQEQSSLVSPLPLTMLGGEVLGWMDERKPALLATFLSLDCRRNVFQFSSSNRPTTLWLHIIQSNSCSQLYWKLCVCLQWGPAGPLPVSVSQWWRPPEGSGACSALCHLLPLFDTTVVASSIGGVWADWGAKVRRRRNEEVVIVAVVGVFIWRCEAVILVKSMICYKTLYLWLVHFIWSELTMWPRALQLTKSVSMTPLYRYVWRTYQYEEFE